MFNRLLNNTTQNAQKTNSDDKSRMMDALKENSAVLDNEDMNYIKGGETNNHHQQPQQQTNHLDLRNIPGGNTPS
jgi:hypothetical protein